MENTKGNMITHKHHIIPRHMNGTDDPSNLIELTIEEHALAHKKLWEDHGKLEDKIAWLCLSGQITKADAIKTIQRHYMTNRIITEDARQNMSLGQKRRFASGNHPMLGKTFSEESRKKMSDSHKGQIPSNKGVRATKEQIEKNKLAQLQVPLYACDECGKMCRGRGNLTQHRKRHID